MSTFIHPTYPLGVGAGSGSGGGGGGMAPTTPADSLAGGDIFAVWQGGDYRALTVDELVDYLETHLVIDGGTT